MVRIKVAFDPQTLRMAHQAARQWKTSHSAFIGKAVRDFVAESRRATEKAAVRGPRKKRDGAKWVQADGSEN